MLQSILLVRFKQARTTKFIVYSNRRIKDNLAYFILIHLCFSASLLLCVKNPYTPNSSCISGSLSRSFFIPSTSRRVVLCEWYVSNVGAICCPSTKYLS